jgi:phosphoribosylaminoimidazole carboxylase (NCAIR synthetase)
MSLGETKTSNDVNMINVIGAHIDAQKIEGVGGIEYDYKKTARPGRKLAHFNLVNASEEVVQQALDLQP